MLSRISTFTGHFAIAIIINISSKVTGRIAATWTCQKVLAYVPIVDHGNSILFMPIFTVYFHRLLSHSFTIHSILPLLTEIYPPSPNTNPLDPHSLFITTYLLTKIYPPSPNTNPLYPYSLFITRYVEMFRCSVQGNAHLVAQWLRIGYTQGNMNSDNTLLAGRTLDYGPYGWMEVGHDD